VPFGFKGTVIALNNERHEDEISTTAAAATTTTTTTTTVSLSILYQPDVWIAKELLHSVYYNFASTPQTTMLCDIEKTMKVCKMNVLIKGFLSKDYYSEGLREPIQWSFVRCRGNPHRPGVFSGRICVKCFGLLVRVENSLIVLKKWQLERLSAAWQRRPSRP